MKTVDISGFGGTYEATCQKMLTAGLKFLSDKSSFDRNSYYQFKNKKIIGLSILTTDDSEALNRVLFDAAGEFGCSRAMHQFVIDHLRYISENSYSTWIDRAWSYEIDDPEREMLVEGL